MVEVVILGSIALDSLETPFGKKERVLGGSASYASTAASLYAKTGVVSIVGEDFPKENTAFLENRGINLSGVEHAQGKTFFWRGKYGYDINAAETLEVQLNVMENFSPKVPEEFKGAEHLFL